MLRGKRKPSAAKRRAKAATLQEAMEAMENTIVLETAAELALARQVGFVLPASRAALSDGVLSELGPLSRLVEQPPPPDAVLAMVDREAPREPRLVLPATPTPLPPESIPHDSVDGTPVLFPCGFAGADEVARRKAELLAAVRDDPKWAAACEEAEEAAQAETMLLMQYNDPFTAPWNRRNEVAIPVSPL